MPAKTPSHKNSPAATPVPPRPSVNATPIIPATPNFTPTSHIPPSPTPPSPSPNPTNRQNAQLSTGPRTPQGKAASSRNATTHGLTVTTHAILKSAQDKTDFEILRDALLSDLKPAPGLEQVFFNHVLIATWNMQRCDAHMAALAERGLDPLDMTFPGAEIATATANISLYYRRNERSLHKALTALRELQAERTYREISQTTEKTQNISTLVRTQPIRRNALHEDHLKSQIEATTVRTTLKVPEIPATAYCRTTSTRVLKAV